MAIPNFFKQNKPRGFNYIPRFYDPKKEEREARRSVGGEPSFAKATDFVRRSGLRPSKAEDEAGSREQGALLRQGYGGRSREQGAEPTPYRSRIMRGSMKNYFPRQRERVERHNMIRLIVIVLILILITYFFLRF